MKLIPKFRNFFFSSRRRHTRSSCTSTCPASTGRTAPRSWRRSNRWLSSAFSDRRNLLMPAVTIEDITKLPRIPAPATGGDAERAVRTVTLAPHGFEGEGFPVRRAFAGADPAHLDPFVHMDQMGEAEYAPGEPKGT